MGDDFLLEAVAQFLGNANWRDELGEFLDLNCGYFVQTDDGYSHWHHERWTEWQAQVEAVLARLLADLGGSVEAIEAAFDARAREPALGPRDAAEKEILSQLLTYGDFEEFCEMMRTHWACHQERLGPLYREEPVQQADQQPQAQAVDYGQYGQVALGDDDGGGPSAPPAYQHSNAVDDETVEQLRAMGFSRVVAAEASARSGARGVDAALEYLQAHPELEAFAEAEAEAEAAQAAQAAAGDPAADEHSQHFAIAQSILEQQARGSLDAQEEALVPWALAMTELAELVRAGGSGPDVDAHMAQLSEVLAREKLQVHLVAAQRMGAENKRLRRRVLEQQQQSAKDAQPHQEQEQRPKATTADELVRRQADVAARLRQQEAKCVGYTQPPLCALSGTALEEVYLHLKEKVHNGKDLVAEADEVHAFVFQRIGAEHARLIPELLEMMLLEEESYELHRRIVRMCSAGSGDGGGGGGDDDGLSSDDEGDSGDESESESESKSKSTSTEGVRGDGGDGGDGGDDGDDGDDGETVALLQTHQDELAQLGRSLEAERAAQLARLHERLRARGLAAGDPEWDEAEAALERELAAERRKAEREARAAQTLALSRAAAQACGAGGRDVSADSAAAVAELRTLHAAEEAAVRAQLQSMREAAQAKLQERLRQRGGGAGAAEAEAEAEEVEFAAQLAEREEQQLQQCLATQAARLERYAARLGEAEQADQADRDQAAAAALRAVFDEQQAALDREMDAERARKRRQLELQRERRRAGSVELTEELLDIIAVEAKAVELAHGVAPAEEAGAAAAAAEAKARAAEAKARADDEIADRLRSQHAAENRRLQDALAAERRKQEEDLARRREARKRAAAGPSLDLEPEGGGQQGEEADDEQAQYQRMWAAIKSTTSGTEAGLPAAEAEAEAEQEAEEKKGQGPDKIADIESELNRVSAEHETERQKLELVLHMEQARQRQATQERINERRRKRKKKKRERLERERLAAEAAAASGGAAEADASADEKKGADSEDGDKQIKAPAKLAPLRVDPTALLPPVPALLGAAAVAPAPLDADADATSTAAEAKVAPSPTALDPATTRLLAREGFGARTAWGEKSSSSSSSSK